MYNKAWGHPKGGQCPLQYCPPHRIPTQYNPPQIPRQSNMLKLMSLTL